MLNVLKAFSHAKFGTSMKVYMIEKYKVGRNKILIKMGNEEIKLGYKLPAKTKLLNINDYILPDSIFAKYFYKDDENENQYILVREISLS